MAKMTRNERLIYQTALEVVGGYENSVMDGLMNADDIDLEDMLGECIDTAFAELPKEVKFVGRKRASEICQMAVDGFEC